MHRTKGRSPKEEALDKKEMNKQKVFTATYPASSVVIMGFKPSFFLFLRPELPFEPGA